MKNILLALIFLVCGNTHAQLDSSFGENGVFDTNLITIEGNPPKFVFDSKGNIYTFGTTRFSGAFLMKIDSGAQSYTITDSNFTLVSGLGQAVDFELRDIIIRNDKLYLVYNIFENRDGELRYNGFVRSYSLSLKIDSTFATNGTFIFESDSMEDSFLESIDFLDNGFILAGGINLRADTSRIGAILKVTTDGKLDSTFGVQGVSQYNISNEQKQGDVYLVNNGFIMARTIPDSFSTHIIKYKTNGIVDDKFGKNGLIRISASRFETPYVQDIVQGKNGEIIFSGHIRQTSSSFNAFATLTDSLGGIKNTFGKDGTVEVEEFNQLKMEEVTNVFITDSGYVLGLNGTAGNRYLAAVMLNLDGSIKQNFVKQGLLFDEKHNSAQMHLKETGELLFLGVSKSNSYLFAQYLPMSIEQTSSLQNLAKNDFKVFPNPSAGSISITSNENIVKYTLVNQNGKIVLAEHLLLAKRNIQIDLKLPKGVYFLQVENSKNQIETHKLIVAGN